MTIGRCANRRALPLGRAKGLWRPSASSIPSRPGPRRDGRTWLRCWRAVNAPSIVRGRRTTVSLRVRLERKSGNVARAYEASLGMTRNSAAGTEAKLAPDGRCRSSQADPRGRLPRAAAIGSRSTCQIAKCRKQRKSALIYPVHAMVIPGRGTSRQIGPSGGRHRSAGGADAGEWSPGARLLPSISSRWDGERRWRMEPVI